MQVLVVNSIISFTEVIVNYCYINSSFVLECDLMNCIKCDGVPAKCIECDKNHKLDEDGKCGKLHHHSVMSWGD